MKYTAEGLRDTLLSMIEEMGNHPEQYAENPGKDFTRRRSLTLPVLMKLILTMDEKSVWKGLLGYFGNEIDTPSAGAFVQQRKKLLPRAFSELFHRFTDALDAPKRFRGYRLLAVDGTSLKSTSYAFLSKEVPGRFVYCPQLYCRADDAIDKRLRIFKTIRSVLEETNGRVVISTECELDGEYRPTNVKENTITADFSRPIRVPMGEQIIRDGPEPPYRPYKKAPKKAKPHKRRNPAPTR